MEGDFPVRKFYEFQMMQLGRTVNYGWFIEVACHKRAYLPQVRPDLGKLRIQKFFLRQITERNPKLKFIAHNKYLKHFCLVFSSSLSHIWATIASSNILKIKQK